MNYKMEIGIVNPDNPQDGITFNWEAQFTYDPETYGNGHYLAIVKENGELFQLYDIRYDRDFRKDDKIEYLKTWARNYWTGRDGAYYLDGIHIEPITA